METQKIVNLLNGSDNENSRFATKNGILLTVSQMVIIHKMMKFLTRSIESSLCDYSDAYILVTGNIVINVDANTKSAFKNCALFENCRTENNDTFVDCVDFINITMPMYNLIEYSGNYSDTFQEVYGILKGIK